MEAYSWESGVDLSQHSLRSGQRASLSFPDFSFHAFPGHALQLVALVVIVLFLSAAYLFAELLEQTASDLVGAVVSGNFLAQENHLVVLLHHLRNGNIERITHKHL